MSYTPKTLVHPGFDPGSPAVFRGPNGDLLPPGSLHGEMVSPGRPGRYPPVDVKSQDEEDQYRAKGYLAKGEQPVKVDGFYDYPKMLVHPEHVPAVPDEIHAEPKEEGKPLKTYVVKGTPEKFPPVTVKNAQEEAEWNDKGYHMPVLADPLAFQKAHSSPYQAGAKVQGYPRWENGILVSDPNQNTKGRQEYPKWVGDKLVNNAKEEFEILGGHDFTDARVEHLISERRLLSEAGDDAGVDRIENILAEHGIQVKDRPHGTVWSRVPVLPKESQPATAPATDRATLIAEAEAKGIKIDKRWNDDKLRSVLAQSAA